MRNWLAYFFDFDGVLADSVEVKTRAFARIFEPYGPKVQTRVVEHHRRHSGVTRAEKFRHYYREFLQHPLDEKELAELCQRFARLVVDEVVGAPEIPGAEAFLRALWNKAPLFVVSAAPEGELREIIERRGWSRYFRAVTGAPRSKKENLAALLEINRLPAERCLFFGDAETDYRAARACGVKFFGILPGPEAALLKTAPDIVWRSNFQCDILAASKNC